MLQTLEINSIEVVSIAKSQVSSALAVGQSNGALHFIDLNELQITKSYSLHSDTITDLQSSTEVNSLFGTSSLDGTIALWDDRIG